MSQDLYLGIQRRIHRRSRGCNVQLLTGCYLEQNHIPLAALTQHAGKPDRMQRRGRELGLNSLQLTRRSGSLHELGPHTDHQLRCRSHDPQVGRQQPIAGRRSRLISQINRDFCRRIGARPRQCQLGCGPRSHPSEGNVCQLQITNFQAKRIDPWSRIAQVMDFYIVKSIRRQNDLRPRVTRKLDMPPFNLDRRPAR